MPHIIIISENEVLLEQLFIVIQKIDDWMLWVVGRMAKRENAPLCGFCVVAVMSRGSCSFKDAWC